ncbi:MAG: hypothetical protein AMXMBFR33_28200 [Candidatus Xenobia bacterium]
MRIFLSLLLAVALPAGAQPYTPETAPEDLKAPTQRALDAFQEVKTRLLGRLGQALQKGGPELAIEVCREEAPRLTTGAVGFPVGRTSHRLRNPKNATPKWAQTYLDQFASQPAEKAPVWVVPLQGRVGVIAPLGTQSLCLQCHGDPGAMPAELRTTLKRLYPTDRATGFEVGDLRGVIWAEVPVDEP